MIYYLIIIISLFYFTLLAAFYIGWKRIPEEKKLSESSLFVSIIIAVRNEEKNIHNLLQQIDKQDYDKQKIELIIVNDHSEDNTIETIQHCTHSFFSLKILHLNAGIAGKKAALHTGIENSTSEFIVTTDADCSMGIYWLKSLMFHFQKYNTNLLIGPVLYTYDANSFQKKFQSLEFLSLVASGAGAMGLKRPIMSNAANLAFKKAAYLQVTDQLFNQHPSGDDVFLLLAIKKMAKEKIHFVKSQDALVVTKAQDSINDFFNQRKRWVSKSKFYKDLDIFATSGIIGVFNFMLVLLGIFSIFNSSFLLPFILCFILKFVADFPLLFSYAKFFANARLMQYFWIAELLYPFYLVFLFFYSKFGAYQWKSRKYRIT